MRILHTSEFYHPSRGGSQELVKRISELLVARGHSVTVATTQLEERGAGELNGVKIEQFAVRGGEVAGYEGEVERYQRYLLDSDFDVMLNYGSQHWATDAVYPILGQLECAKVLAPCGFSMLYSRAFAAYFAELPKFLHGYDRLLFHGERYRDYAFARDHGLDRITVIPNGASRLEFEHSAASFRELHGIPRDIPLLLTVGSHTGAKGHAAAIDCFRRARIGRAVLVVIGNTVEGGRSCLSDCLSRVRRTRWLSLGRKRVLLLDPPREEIVSAFQAADLFVFPSEVECSPVVLFEAVASRTPFISTACGNVEEILDWTGGGVVVGSERRRSGKLRVDRRELVAAIERLVRQPDRARKMGESGHAAWLREFTWEHITRRYEALYTELLGSSS